jgi:hypothetical protein
MSLNASHSTPRTPAAVLVGVSALVLAALLSIPVPLFAGLLLCPAFIASAALGYLSRRWGPIVAAAVSSATLLLAATSVLRVFVQQTSDLALFAAAGSFIAFLSAVCGYAGAVSLWWGRRTKGATRAPAMPPAPTAGSPRRFPSSPTPFRSPQDNPSAPLQKDNLEDDAARVARAAATGARKAAAGTATAWRAYQRHAESARERADIRRQRREAEQQSREQAQRDREDDEMRRARLQQARDYNNNRFWL